MPRTPSRPNLWKNGYPTSDGKSADSDWHRDLMWSHIDILKRWYVSRRRVYVSGNLLLYYEEGNRRRRVSPDVFVVKGVANHLRPNYLLWEEGKGPDVVIELTSSMTRREDLRTKIPLYQDMLHVKEYFLFDPLGDYLSPRLQGHRLRQGQYRPIRPVAGRLPSQVLRLHLEASGHQLRLFNPATGCWLSATLELLVQAKAGHLQIAEAHMALQDDEAARQQAEAEVRLLRQQLAGMRRRLDRLNHSS
jgi:Uma2 family endonuclease